MTTELDLQFINEDVIEHDYIATLDSLLMRMW